MGKLDSLKIDDSPLAFAGFAAKHNALVDLLAGMVGQNGISVVMAEKNAIIRANIAAGPAGNVILSNTANVVGFNGLLQNVYIGNVIANAYPERLRTQNASTTCTFDGAGGNVATGSFSVTMDPVNGELTLLNLTNSTYIKLKCPTSGGPDLILQGTVRSLEMREIDVCDAGVAKKMLIIGSEPY